MAFHVKMSNGAEHVIDTPGRDEDDALLAEIAERENDYEWIPAADGRVVRVEAIDEMWID